MEERTGSGGVAILERPQDTATESDLCHFFCTDCYPDDEYVIAFCGTDISGDEEDALFDDEADCVVCLDIRDCPNDHPDDEVVIFDEWTP
jgi:hypothetical protein